MPFDLDQFVLDCLAAREADPFHKLVRGAGGGKLEAAGAKALSERDAEPLGDNIIHSVTNPIRRFTGALHVYGGDFFGAQRSEWDPETLLEERYNLERAMRQFEEANGSQKA